MSLIEIRAIKFSIEDLQHVCRFCLCKEYLNPLFKDNLLPDGHNIQEMINYLARCLGTVVGIHFIL